MKFNITHTSGGPVEQIEIYTIEGLTALSASEGHPLIVSKPYEYGAGDKSLWNIEVYDDYRE